MMSQQTELDHSAELSDGSHVRIRPVRPTDGDALRREIAAADDETLYNRFFTPRPRFDDDVIDYLTNLDQDRRVGLVASIDDVLVGIVRYEALPEPHRAEVAIAVKTGWRSRGLGRLLLDRVVARARERGFHVLEAVCLEENGAAICMLESIGFRFDEPDAGIRTGTLHLTSRSDANAESSSPH